MKRNRLSVLLIDEDENMHYFIRRFAKQEGYRLFIAKNGQEGLTCCTSTCPDFILLDIRLADMDGIHIIETLRKWSDIPILVVSDYSDSKHKTESLLKGADDYILKPFDPEEFRARIYTVLRRGHKQNMLSYEGNGLLVDFNKREVKVRGQRIHLSPMEYKILSYLAMNAGKVVTYRMLMEQLWGPYVNGDNKILRVNMTNIRRKIEVNPAEPEFILTENRIGYRMLEGAPREAVI